jgi:hypothetical protein
MCMIDTCDPVDWYDSRIVAKSRKEHRCVECHRTIRVGESYEYNVNKFMGDITVNKTCAHCIEARKWLEAECGGFVWRGVKEDLYDHWCEERYQYDDTKTIGLIKLIVGMRRKWTKLNGELMPLPKVESGGPSNTEERADATEAV